MSTLAYGWVERCNDVAGCGQVLHQNISTPVNSSLQLYLLFCELWWTCECWNVCLLPLYDQRIMHWVTMHVNWWIVYPIMHLCRLVCLAFLLCLSFFNFSIDLFCLSSWGCWPDCSWCSSRPLCRSEGWGRDSMVSELWVAAIGLYGPRRCSDRR